MEFISAGEVFLAAMNVISEIEPTGTGVLTAIPSNFPAYSGSVLVIAIAAPVDAGARLIAADLPIRGSLFEGESTRDCEAVNACTVFKIAFFIPSLLPRISMITPILFVVQLPQENTATLPSA